jgi:hypothetical protein
LFHSLIKSYPFLDGTKRTAFAAAVYFLHERGYTLQRPFRKDEIIRFCVGLAEEGQRRAEPASAPPDGQACHAPAQYRQQPPSHATIQGTRQASSSALARLHITTRLDPCEERSPA